MLHDLGVPSHQQFIVIITSVGQSLQLASMHVHLAFEIINVNFQVRNMRGYIISGDHNNLKLQIQMVQQCISDNVCSS